MSKRFVRFKEITPGTNYSHKFTEEQLAAGDGSLSRELIRVRADANGFIMNGNDIEAEDCVIWAGDSVIESINLPESDRVCSVLERLLAADGHAVSVKNAAFSGATTLHTINVVLNKLLPLKPKALIVTTGAIDYTACIREKGFWSANPFLNPLALAEGEMPDDFEPLIPPRFETRTALQTCLHSICVAFGVPLILTTIACKSMQDPWTQRYFWEKRLDISGEIYPRMNAATRRLCARAPCDCLDLEAAFRGKDAMFYDHVHFNSAGARVVAEMARQALRPYL